MIRNSRLAAGVLALALAGTAQATSLVVSTLSNLTYTTTGSVAQTYTYYPYASTYVYTYDHEVNGSGSGLNVINYLGDSDYSYGGTAYGGTGSVTPISSSVSSTAGASASASVTATSLTASASTGLAGGQAYSSASLSDYFTLGAYSSLTVTWASSVVGSNDGVNAFLNYYNSYGSGYSNVYLGYTSSSTSAGGYSYYGNDFGYSFEDGATLKKLVIKTGATGLSIGFGANVYANTVDYANPVPEPETWALALVGLGIVGNLARRRIKA